MKKAIDMKYITYDKKLETYRVRVPGAGQVTIKLLDDAVKERDKRVEMVQKGKINIDSSITFNDWFYYWLEKYCTTGNQRTKEGYRDDIERSCQSIFNKKMLNIKPYHISELLLEMAKNNLAYSTIRRTKAILGSVFNSIRDNGFIDYDRLPTDYANLPPKTATKYVQVPRQAYSAKELDILVDAARNFSSNGKTCKTYTVALLILTRSGLRLSELLGLCWNDITFVNNDEMTISIKRTVHSVKNSDGSSWIIAPTKSEKSKRTLLIKDKHCVYLTQSMCSLAHHPISYGNQEYDFVFSTRTGRPISKSNFTRNFVKIRKIIGSDIRIHEIRHSVATLMANNPSISYNNAAAFMGHSLNVFMRYYVHPGEDLLNSCSQAISDAFKKK